MRRHKRKIIKLRGTRHNARGKSKRGRGRGSRMTNARTFGTNIAHVMKYQPWRIRKKGFATRFKKMKAINLRDLEKLSPEETINIIEYGYDKVIGGGMITKPLQVKAKAFTKGAKEKIEKSGGKAIIIGGSNEPQKV